MDGFPLAECILKTNIKNVDIVPANNRMDVLEHFPARRLNYALILRDAIHKSQISMILYCWIARLR
jgi:hypothetical protein